MSDIVLTNIKRLVAERDFSLSEACRRAGLATNYLSDKAGKANKAIADDILARFAEVLEVGIGELREGEVVEAEPAPAARPDDRRVRIPLAQLRLSDLNPRTEIDEDAISDLASNISENGLLENLVVRPRPRLGFNGPIYEVIAGGRRLAALELLAHENILPEDLTEGVPCLVVDGDDAAMVLLGLAENMQREAMNPMDEAHSIRRLNQDMGMSTAEIAASLGLSQRAVQQRLTFVTKLSPANQTKLREGVITYRQALDLVQQHRAPEPPAAASETVSPPLPLGDASDMKEISCPCCPRKYMIAARVIVDKTWVCPTCYASGKQVPPGLATPIESQVARKDPEAEAGTFCACSQCFELKLGPPGEIPQNWHCDECAAERARRQAAASEADQPLPLDPPANEPAVDAEDRAESDRLATAIESAKQKFAPPIRVSPDMEYLTEVIAQELAEGFPGAHVFWCLVAVPPWTETSKPVIYAGSGNRADAQEAVTELAYTLDALAANGLTAPRLLTAEELRARQTASLANLATQSLEAGHGG